MYTAACVTAALPAEVMRSKIPKEEMCFCLKENNKPLECDSFALSNLSADK